jgi:hypothetical protein
VRTSVCAIKETMQLIAADSELAACAVLGAPTGLHPSPKCVRVNLDQSGCLLNREVAIVVSGTDPLICWGVAHRPDFRTDEAR